MFNASVTNSSNKPNANAASVFALSNSWSPTSNVTICTVTVVTAAKGNGIYRRIEYRLRPGEAGLWITTTLRN